MKIILIAILSFFVTISVFSQTGTSTTSKSKTKQITFTRSVNTNVVRLLPDLIIVDQAFTDLDSDNIIEVDENSAITFELQNIGEGEAQDVSIKVTLLNGPIQGLNFSQLQSIGIIYPTQRKTISIPLTGDLSLVSGKARFKIEAIEKNGLDAFPLEMEIPTKEFSQPEVIIADALFSTEDGGKIKLNSPINLKVLVQNTGPGEARDVNAEFILENADCVILEDNKFNIGSMEVGESRELNFIFTATRKYTFDQIPVRVSLSEHFGKYAESKSISVGLEQNLAENNTIVINGIESEKTTVTRVSLTSDVDKNIPVNPNQNAERLCLIIGNEDYSSQQSGLNSEANVKYARNDARIFSEYAKMTLGVKEENLFLLYDATSGMMQQKVEQVSALASKIGPGAEIIFFYAGHGLPEENTKTPYLIPVDVTGSNLVAAIKLSDIYKKFGESGSSKVSIFLDACFSGGGRESGLVAARGVKIKPREESLSGNIIVFTASSGEQSALPYNEKQHGMFTYFLLKKLQESSGNVTYMELSDYVSKNVGIESLRINAKSQDPVTNISPLIENTWKTWKIN